MNEIDYYAIYAVFGGLPLAVLGLLELFGFEEVPEQPLQERAGLLPSTSLFQAYCCMHGSGGGGLYLKFLCILSPVLVGMTCFGLMGLGLTLQDWDPDTTRMLAWAAGFAGLATVVVMPRLLEWSAEVPVHIREALEQTGVIEQVVPALKAGTGTVRLSVRGRTVVYKAISSQQEIPPDTTVLIIGLVTLDTVEVVARVSQPAAVPVVDDEDPALFHPEPILPALASRFTGRVSSR
jgi:hypothetical protein